MADALFDTTVFIDWLRGDGAAKQLVDDVLQGRKTASYSAITMAELWQNEQIDRQTEIEYQALASEFLEEAPLVSEAAKRAGVQLRDLSRNRRRELFADALIAATAEIRGETVYSRNDSDLRRFYSRVETY